MIYILSDIWQSTGLGSIIYLWALTAVEPALYKAPTMVGKKISVAKISSKT